MRERRSKAYNKKARKRRNKTLIKSNFKPGLNELYKLMQSRFGFLNWWPGDTKFEIFVGAILTQQTSWSNVAKVIQRLKDNNLLNLNAIIDIDQNKLEELIKPSGYYRQKSKRLKEICNIIKANYGDLNRLFELDKIKLRNTLLNLKGVGKETADSIILYAAEKPIFVIDAYTKRIMHRIYNIPEDISYDILQDYFETELKKDLILYKDMHAQFVELGKTYCRKKPECNECPIKIYCKYENQNKQ
ncbi:MAG: endonuclease III domain-containing protein [Candidatus Micrarchaeia archaeon]